MRKTTVVAMLAVAVLTLPATSFAQQLFDFDGQAVLPASVGGTLDVYTVVLDASPTFTTPLPLDFANFQYTLVLQNVVLDSESGSTQFYSGGSITLYEDASTPANYGDPSSFTDGTALLSGTFSTLSRSSLLSLIQASGSVDWTGGTRLGDLAPADQSDWGFFASITPSLAEPGYDENWDGKVEPREPVVSNEQQSFGDLKSGW